MQEYQNYMFSLLKLPKNYPDDFTIFRTNSYATIEVAMYFFTQEHMLSIKASALITAKGNHGTEDIELKLFSEHPATCYSDYADLRLARIDDIFTNILNAKKRHKNNIVLNVVQKSDESIEKFISTTNDLFIIEINKLFNKNIKIKNTKTGNDIKISLSDNILSKLRNTFLRAFNKSIKFSNSKINDKYRFYFGDGALSIMKEVIIESDRCLLKSKLEGSLSKKEIKINNKIKVWTWIIAKYHVVIMY